MFSPDATTVKKKKKKVQNLTAVVIFKAVHRLSIICIAFTENLH